MDSEKQWNGGGGGEEEELKEGQIPVLTVLKNKSILKNIFIVNKPPEKESRADHVDVLLVGRHPDCDLMLTHPSISRFHLQIRSTPSSRTFSLLDLSSVHGTWVSGRRIEPMVSVDMKEGDTLRIGVSSRIYRLHWIPISRAYDLENPFVAQLDAVVEQDEEEQEEEVEEEEQMQKLNCSPAEMEETESVNSIVEDLSSLFLDENVERAVEEEIPLEPWRLEDMVSLCCEEERKSPSKEEAIGIPSDPFGTETSYLPTVYDADNNLCDSMSQILSSPYVESCADCDDTMTENLSETLCLPTLKPVLETKMLQFHTPADTFTSPLSSGHENSFEKHYSSLPVNTGPASLDEKSAAEAVIPKQTEAKSLCTVKDDESNIDVLTVPASLHEKSAAEDVITPKESESECTLRDDGSITDAFIAGAGIFNSEDMFLPVEEAMPCTKVEQIKIVKKVAMNSLSDEEKQDMYGSLAQLLNDKACHDQGHSLKEIQDVRTKHLDNTFPTTHQIESVNLSMPQEVVSNIMNEDQTLHSDVKILETCVKAMEKTSTDIWSRRGKATSAPQVRTSKRILKNAANVDAEVAISNVKKGIRNCTISKNLNCDLDRGEVEEEEDEEIFTPDKENISPNTLQLQFLKKVKVEEVKYSKSQRSRRILRDTFNCDIYPNESIDPTLCKTNKKDLFSVLDGEVKEKEIFTPEKENLSSNSLQLQLLKKKGKVEEINRSKSQRSPLSKGTFNLDTYPNENIGSTLCKMNQKDSINRTISRDLFSDLDGEEEEEEIFTPDKENFSPNTLQLRLLKKKGGKVEEIKRPKSQRSPLSKSNPDMYANENMGSTLCKMSQKDILNNTISKDLFSDLVGEEEEEEIFTPDKENFSPNSLQLQLLKKKGKLEEIENSKSPWKENQKLQRKPFSSHINLAQEQDLVTFEDRVARVPFQSLKTSEDKKRSSTFCPASTSESFNFSNCAQILDQRINLSDIGGVPKKRSWDMIVDTTSLVNRESRKALQLLQGLKGTRLIIPKLVIRELDRMKQQYTIFRRISEASLALEWIEECMVKTNWWIHIQSSVDESRLIAPTPPATPQTQFSEESWTSLSSQNCSIEIASPTVEDHILNFALLYRRNQNDGLLVVLSEDATLKIKCMAEGLLCEPVQEFRECLVNPFSERFLWDNSVPRGQTWSCQDDVVLREKYRRLRKSSKGVASGLKLILLHNSQYGL